MKYLTNLEKCRCAYWCARARVCVCVCKRTYEYMSVYTGVSTDDSASGFSGLSPVYASAHCPDLSRRNTQFPLVADSHTNFMTFVIRNGWMKF